ncbi:2Fe-2S iron-sulfur cluster-binding protein [Rhodanobacter terrae]|uniref:2Fe-2S iron-sulfur cluster-binding protein n=1 Tax=Rhodanobacter terrae TaxID=418647 RepID=A0ABW0T2M4_9GAMM
MSRRRAGCAAQLGKTASLPCATQHTLRAFWTSCRLRRIDQSIPSTGKLIHVAPEETAAAALRRCGFDIPVSCAEGLCGTCLTKVIDGDIEHNDLFLTAEERARNDQFTPCCSRANSPTLILDL